MKRGGRVHSLGGRVLSVSFFPERRLRERSLRDESGGRTVVSMCVLCVCV